MDGFFHAQSVAVIGVSTAPTNLGRIMVYNLMEFRYTGHIYLVGPRGGAFLGHKIYKSVADLPEPVDLATILVPAAAVAEVMRQCGEKGIRRVVVQSAGFGELGEDRAALEAEIRQIIERYGLRMIGPNCIGVINRKSGLAVPFMPFKAESEVGRVAIISQSGGVGGLTINALAAEHLGFGKFASIGNKLNVDETDLLEYFVQDAETDLIFCYLEGIARGRRLMEIACRSSKVIVAHKSNRGPSGAVAAKSHSASLSSDDRVVDAAFRQSGIFRAYDQQEALHLMKAFMLPEIKGNRLAIISRSGGHAVMAADAAEESGFVLPPYPEALIRMVKEHSRANVIRIHNPLDLGDLYDIPLYLKLAESALAREDIDGLLFIYNYQGIFDAEVSRRLIAGLGELASQSEKPLAICVFTMHRELDKIRRTVKCPIFTDPREAVRAFARGRDRRRLKALPFSTERPAGVDRDTARSVFAKAASGPMDPAAAAAVLSGYGIPLVPWKTAESEEAAVSAAAALDYPVALKTAHPEVLHKSDAGAVCLDLRDGASVRSAYQNLRKIAPSVLLQKMAEPGLEWLVGGRQDEQFGPVVVAGLGGIYVEVFQETAIRIAPVTAEEAERLVDECRGANLLGGVRGQPPLDRRALIDIIVRVSWLLADFPQIKEIDLNPVRVFKKGCQTLDWRVLNSGAMS
ncbi:MAG: acetate--CoA ligase family protein [Pseudomonadota bacterium]